MTEDEDAKTLKILEDLIRRVVREELEKRPVIYIQPSLPQPSPYWPSPVWSGTPPIVGL